MLHHDLDRWHDLSPLECIEVARDAPELPALLVDRRRDLRLTQPQHPAELLDRELAVDRQELPDLLQADTELAQHEDPAQHRELAHFVRAVAGRRIDVRGFEDADVAVVADRPRRYVSEVCELTDAQHDDPSCTP